MSAMMVSQYHPMVKFAKILTSARKTHSFAYMEDASIPKVCCMAE